jgi:hypothetical protein
VDKYLEVTIKPISTKYYNAIVLWRKV